jgi:glycerate 2-kinase
MNTDIPSLLHQSFQHLLTFARPDAVMKAHIPRPPKGRLIVIGAGKASAAMAAAFEEHYTGVIEGIIVTRYGFEVPTKHIKILQAAHPVPDLAGVAAVEQIMALLKTAGEDDLVICLLSGGGSALLTAPVADISFEDIQTLNKQLLASGAPIQDMNIVRKHLNKALGGGLAQALPHTKLITLSISDVVGDDPSSIASGPTVADPSTLKNAADILRRYEITPPASIEQALQNPANETPKPGDPIFDKNEYVFIATPSMALNAAANFWKDHGYTPLIWDQNMEGDTNLCARKHVDFIQHILDGHENIPRPCAIISGGETTVKITGNGTGGPNTQFMLQSAILLNGAQNIYGMACDTDGIDGAGDNAGAYITPDTLLTAKEKELDAASYLRDNNSYHFFKKMGQLIKSGPTYTNVNDIRIFLINA